MNTQVRLRGRGVVTQAINFTDSTDKKIKLSDIMIMTISYISVTVTDID